MFQEYPKALYLGADVEQAVKVVFGEQEEADAREAGYRSLGEGAPDERDALAAEAGALGIAVDGRWSVKRIQAEIAKVKA